MSSSDPVPEVTESDDSTALIEVHYVIYDDQTPFFLCGDARPGTAVLFNCNFKKDGNIPDLSLEFMTWPFSENARDKRMEEGGVLVVPGKKKFRREGRTIGETVKCTIRGNYSQQSHIFDVKDGHGAYRRGYRLYIDEKGIEPKEIGYEFFCKDTGELDFIKMSVKYQWKNAISVRLLNKFSEKKESRKIHFDYITKHGKTYEDHEWAPMSTTKTDEPLTLVARHGYEEQHLIWLKNLRAQDSAGRNEGGGTEHVVVIIDSEGTDDDPQLP